MPRGDAFFVTFSSFYFVPVESMISAFSIPLQLLEEQDIKCKPLIASIYPSIENIILNVICGPWEACFPSKPLCSRTQPFITSLWNNSSSKAIVTNIDWTRDFKRWDYGGVLMLLPSCYKISLILSWHDSTLSIPLIPTNVAFSTYLCTWKTQGCFSTLSCLLFFLSLLRCLSLSLFKSRLILLLYFFQMYIFRCIAHS